MKPAPPVIMIFLTSGRGSNFVEPMRTGALFQTLLSSKKDASAFADVGVLVYVVELAMLDVWRGDSEKGGGFE
jgi:hypothetical protein